MKKMLFVIVSALAVFYIIIAGVTYFRQDSMLYFPVRELSQTPRDIGMPFEEIMLITHDNIDISAWYIPAAGSRGVVLFCHGNAGNISHRLDSISIFHHFNLDVLIFDYRGYGRSGGSPSENGTYLDAEAAWDYLVNVRKFNPQNIIVFGRSLGSAVAAELALRHAPGVLIIESGFTSIPDLGKKYYPWLPVRLLSRYSYSTVEKVKKITSPKLIIHSPQDEIIPFSHGTALFENSLKPAEFLVIQGNHNEGFMISGRIYVDGINQFIAKHLAL